MPEDQDETAPLLEMPTDLEEIWLARGEEVQPARPLIQGDVFADVALPGLGDAPGLAVIIDHPCSMRSGVTLRPRIQMLRIREERASLKGGVWPTGQYRLMPLPGLRGDTRYAAFFDETAMIPAADLASAHRTACLSEYGILVLQQRLVHHLTRVRVGIKTLREASINILEEVTLQEEWTIELATGEPEAYAREAASFDAFMRAPLSEESGPSRRDALRNDVQRSAVRKAVRQEIRRRTAE